MIAFTEVKIKRDVTYWIYKLNWWRSRLWNKIGDPKVTADPHVVYSNAD